MANAIVHAPVAVAKRTCVVNGRSYTGAPGTALSVEDADAKALAANGWIYEALTGATTDRPTAINGVALRPGFKFADTTVGYTVMWDGAAWRNPVTGAAA